MSEFEKVLRQFYELHEEGQPLQVDEFFGDGKLTAMPYFPHRTTYESAEALRQAFDRPEELMVVSGPYGEAILHRSQHEALQRRQDVVKEVLAEAGYTEEDIPMISFEEVLELRKKIQARSV